MELAVVFRCALMINVFSAGIFTDGQVTDSQRSVEERLDSLELAVVNLKEAIEALPSSTSGYCELYWSKWGAWSTWSSCSGQCDGGHSSRLQFRQRQRTCIKDPTTAKNRCTGSDEEKESRLCNTVELYGCLSDTAANNSYYGIAYNFFDQMAQSTCTAALTSPAHAAAVRRDCGTGTAATCNTICSNLGYTCFESLHVYKSFTPLKPNIDSHPDEGKEGLSMYRYFSCSFARSCGPNYCCCKW